VIGTASTTLTGKMFHWLATAGRPPSPSEQHVGVQAITARHHRTIVPRQSFLLGGLRRRDMERRSLTSSRVEARREVGQPWMLKVRQIHAAGALAAFALRLRSPEAIIGKSLQEIAEASLRAELRGKPREPI
jgi:hypothetical protein